MYRFCLTCLWARAIACLALLMVSLGTFAQTSVPINNAGSPYFCDARFYQTRADTSLSTTSPTARTYLVRYGSLAAGATADSPYGNNYIGVGLNALGFNPRDNYLYALSFGTTNDTTLYRIGQTGAEPVGTVSGGTIPATGFVTTAGVFDKQGRYYFAGQGGTPNSIVPSVIYRVDNIPAFGTATLVIAKEYVVSPSTINIGDFAFLDNTDGINGILYGGTGGTFARIQLNNAASTAVVSTVTVAPNVGGIGSAFYDRPTNQLYVFSNAPPAFSLLGNIAGPGAATSVQTTVTAPGFIPAGYTNTASDGTSCIFADPAVKSADINIRKSVVPLTPVLAGQTVTFTIAVGNLGTNPAQSVTVADPLPAGLNFVSASATAGSYVPVPGTWTIPNLASGITQTLTIVATVNTAGTNTTSFVNVATVNGSSQAGTTTVIPLNDSVPGNNSSTATPTVTISVNLTISKTDNISAVAAGGTTSYTITVANLSGFNAANSTLKDPVATGLSCTTAPSCVVLTGTATCPAPGAGAGQLSIANLQGSGVSIPLLAVGSSMAFVVTCGVTATGQP